MWLQLASLPSRLFDHVQTAVWQNRSFRVSLTNYTKRGIPFTNNLHIVPVDAVAADQSYFYATSHITLHPDAGASAGESEWESGSLASERAFAFCAGSDGYMDPQAPPDELLRAPDPSHFFREASAAERALTRFNRETALARYAEKRKKRIGVKAGLRRPPQKKQESRQVIACNRPRVRGRFIKTGAPVNYKEQQEADGDYDTTVSYKEQHQAHSLTESHSLTHSLNTVSSHCDAGPQCDDTVFSSAATESVSSAGGNADKPTHLGASGATMR